MASDSDDDDWRYTRPIALNNHAFLGEESPLPRSGGIVPSSLPHSSASSILRGGAGGGSSSSEVKSPTGSGSSGRDFSELEKILQEQELIRVLGYQPRQPTGPTILECAIEERKAQMERHQAELDGNARRAASEAFDGLRRYMLDGLSTRLAAELRRLEVVQQLQDEAMAARLASEVRACRMRAFYPPLFHLLFTEYRMNAFYPPLFLSLFTGL